MPCEAFLPVAISNFMNAIALPGRNPLGHVRVQFRMVWLLLEKNKKKKKVRRWRGRKWVKCHATVPGSAWQN